MTTQCMHCGVKITFSIHEDFCLHHLFGYTVDEDARKKIHDAGGTKSLFEWYMDMDIVVQLETLAALVKTIPTNQK